MRPRTASYVRSSESYTHMGTLPRLLWRKKGNKEGSSSSKKGGLSRSQTQRPLGFKDRDPPRTRASPCKETGDEAEGKAVTGTLSQDSVSDLNTQLEPSGEATTTQNIISAPTAACKDVAPSGGSMDALQSERTCDKEVITQEETREDEGDSSRTHSHMEPNDGQAEYVQHGPALSLVLFSGVELD
ncbi:unnamed protein product [Pleuronectes platessa]|uniref:Uncharacterized protein n=1 Tax=Pleuronectes platessa TaxID=8262 RepID=A0A9N7YA67_PLEPL|nr:unnamed protein product [Pleuronectes platessa]